MQVDKSDSWECQYGYLSGVQSLAEQVLHEQLGTLQALAEQVLQSSWVHRQAGGGAATFQQHSQRLR